MNDPEIDQLAPLVAAELGDGWNAERDADLPNPRLVHRDGRRLTIARVWNRPGRITVSGVVPPTEMYRPTRSSITIAIARGPREIARDIARRVLPDYDTAYAEVLAFNREQTDNARLRGAVLGRLQAVLGGHVREGSREHTLHVYQDTAHHDRGPGAALACASVDLRARGDGSCIDLNLGDVPADVAERIALLLAAAAAGIANPLHSEVQHVLDQLDLVTPSTAAHVAANTGLSDTDAAVVLEALCVVDCAAVSGEGYRLTLIGRHRQAAAARHAS